MEDTELDARGAPPAAQLASILRRFDVLAPGTSLSAVTDLSLEELRRGLDREHPRGFRLDVDQEAGAGRIHLIRLASTALPRRVGDAEAPVGGDPDAVGAVWKLDMSQRDLDANVIRLRSGEVIGRHVGPDLDVLLLILDGDGEVATEVDVLPIAAQALVWLPRRSVREIRAGEAGLVYFSVHQRRQALTLGGLGGPR